MQAGIARAAGRDRLALNLERAAELVAVPQDVILETYEMLRPGRLSDPTFCPSARTCCGVTMAPTRSPRCLTRRWRSIGGAIFSDVVTEFRQENE